MTLPQSLEHALESADLVGALRNLAEKQLAAGTDKAVLLEAFEQLRQRCRAADRERDEDAVMDVMDFLVGWCSPHVRLSV